MSDDRDPAVGGPPDPVPIDRRPGPAIGGPAKSSSTRTFKAAGSPRSSCPACRGVSRRGDTRRGGPRRWPATRRPATIDGMTDRDGEPDPGPEPHGSVTSRNGPARNSSEDRTDRFRKETTERSDAASGHADLARQEAAWEDGLIAIAARDADDADQDRAAEAADARPRGVSRRLPSPLPPARSSGPWSGRGSFSIRVPKREGPAATPGWSGTRARRRTKRSSRARREGHRRPARCKRRSSPKPASPARSSSPCCKITA